MTKDELRKEATSTIEWESTPIIDRPLFVHGYITGAEPREKRISELEKENAELNDKLKLWVETAKLRLANWQKLDKELNEAKEIMKGILNADSGLDMLKAQHKAEKFLKEVENDKLGQSQNQIF